MKNLVKPIALYGNMQFPAPPREVRAGMISAWFENHWLRYLKVEEHEIVRTIYPAVRDHDWLTIPAIEHRIESRIGTDDFTIAFHALHRSETVLLESETIFNGTKDGTVHVLFRGKALKEFQSNRIGLCVHHPIAECRSRPCCITTSDGSIHALKFPDSIDPAPPFTDIQCMTYETHDGIVVKVDFRGEQFEMEDQRNWSDASFKTYGTPLSRGFPVLIPKGRVIEQSIHISVQMPPRKGPRSVKRDPVIRISEDSSAAAEIPRFGLHHGMDTKVLGSRELILLKQLPVNHYRVEINLSEPDWEAAFTHFLINAREMKAKLMAVLVFEHHDPMLLQKFQEVCAQLKVTPESIILLSRKEKATPDDLIQTMVPRLRKFFPDCRIGAGTNAYFAELNRSKFKADLLDFIVFSANPQVHAEDFQSVVENVPALGDAVRAARKRFHDKQIVVSPLTLKRRFNPDATSIDDPLPKSGIPWNVDLRQPSLFAACWLLACITELSEACVDEVTLFEPVGMKGMMAEENQVHSSFRMTKAGIFPCFALLLQFRDVVKARRMKTGDPMFIYGIQVIRRDGRLCCLICNLDHKRRRISCDEISEGKDLHILNHHNPQAFERIAKIPKGAEIELQEFSILKIEDKPDTERKG